MKLYDFALAPNPKRLRVYLAEKGIAVPTEQVNILSGDNRKPEFLAKNPLGGLPVLELDDGKHLTESLAIMEYFEDLHPNPPMLGSTPIERARAREAERIIELGILGRIATIFQNTSPFFAGRVKQSPEAAESAKNVLEGNLRVLNDMIGSNPFVAGSKPTIADCTLHAALGFAEFAQVPIDAKYANLHRWWESFKQRPSAAA